MAAPGSPEPFVPGDFAVPGELVTAEFRLEPLGPQHNAADYEAWTSSMAHIRATPGFAGKSWPTEMTPEENLGDLRGHAADFAARTGFTYTVLDPGGRVVGCVYIYPWRDEEGAPGEDGARRPGKMMPPAGKMPRARRVLTPGKMPPAGRVRRAPRAWPACIPGSGPTGPSLTCRSTPRSRHGWPTPGRSRRSGTRRARRLAARARTREPREMPGDSPPGGAELLAAAEEIIAAAATAGATVRLLGGIAVYQLAPSARTAPLARPYHDYDVVVPSRQRAAAARVFRDAGYSEDQQFNALHGAQRMIFAAPAGFVVDVLVGTFQMCHRLALGQDLPAGGLTIHPADLLLTKLQIVQIEEKDLLDAVALLLDLPPDGSPAGIEAWPFRGAAGRRLGFPPHRGAEPAQGRRVRPRPAGRRSGASRGGRRGPAAPGNGGRAEVRAVEDARPGRRKGHLVRAPRGDRLRRAAAMPAVQYPPARLAPGPAHLTPPRGPGARVWVDKVSEWLLT